MTTERTTVRIPDQHPQNSAARRLMGALADLTGDPEAVGTERTAAGPYVVAATFPDLATYTVAMADLAERVPDLAADAAECATIAPEAAYSLADYGSLRVTFPAFPAGPPDPADTVAFISYYGEAAAALPAADLALVAGAHRTSGTAATRDALTALARGERPEHGPGPILTLSPDAAGEPDALHNALGAGSIVWTFTTYAGDRHTGRVVAVDDMGGPGALAVEIETDDGTPGAVLDWQTIARVEYA